MIQFYTQPMEKLAKALVLCLLIIGSSFMILEEADAAERVAQMTITANGAVKGVPDQATIHLGVRSQAKTARAALSANTKQMQALVDLLKAEGLKKKHIQTTQFNVQPQYRHIKGQGRSEIWGYQVSNEVFILVKDIGKMGAILDMAVTAGANQVHSIQFGFSNMAELKDQARKNAVKKVRGRAQLYAEAAGVKLGRVLSISESGGGHQPRPMTRVSMAKDSADVPIEAGESSVDARVSMTYELLND